MSDRVVYGNTFIMVLTGICMSFEMQRKNAAIVYLGQLLYHLIITLTGTHMGYTDWLRVSLVGS